MLETMTNEEIFILAFGCVAILWGLYRILTSGRYGSSFPYWVLVLGTGASIYLWRSGQGIQFYTWIKNLMMTTY